MNQIKLLNSLSISQKQSCTSDLSSDIFFARLISVFCSMSIEPNWNGGSVEFATNTRDWKFILQRHLWYHHCSLSGSLLGYTRAKLTRSSCFVVSTYKRLFVDTKGWWRSQGDLESYNKLYNTYLVFKESFLLLYRVKNLSERENKIAQIMYFPKSLYCMPS